MHITQLLQTAVFLVVVVVVVVVDMALILAQACVKAVWKKKEGGHQ
jgi:hypothetical protein